MCPDGATTHAQRALPRLDIWYICDLSLCNYDCAYCVSGSPETGGSRTRQQMWKEPDGPQRLHRILNWISGLPYCVGLRLQTIGEPFVSEEFLAEASRITRHNNIRFVELVTNGSLLTSRLTKMRDEHHADLAKLTLWITYHHTETAIERCIENAVFARQQGAFVVINALLFPDTIEPISRLQALCKVHELPVNVDYGQDFNDSYGGHDFIPLVAGGNSSRFHALIGNRRMALISVVAAALPKGLSCSAGHNYIFINPEGAVFPCLGYQRYAANSQLGSALNPDFVPQLRARPYRPCGIDRGCTCKEDFLHLELAQPGPAHERSLGFWPTNPEAPLDPLLVERMQRVDGAALLADAQFWKLHGRVKAHPG